MPDVYKRQVQDGQLGLDVEQVDLVGIECNADGVSVACLGGGSEMCIRDSLSTADPWVVVAEDTGVLLVAWGIAGDFAQIEPVGGVGGLEQYLSLIHI